MLAALFHSASVAIRSAAASVIAKLKHIATGDHTMAENTALAAQLDKIKHAFAAQAAGEAARTAAAVQSALATASSAAADAQAAEDAALAQALADELTAASAPTGA